MQTILPPRAVSFDKPSLSCRSRLLLEIPASRGRILYPWLATALLGQRNARARARATTDHQAGVPVAKSQATVIPRIDISAGIRDLVASLTKIPRDSNTEDSYIEVFSGLAEETAALF